MTIQVSKNEWHQTFEDRELTGTHKEDEPADEDKVPLSLTLTK